MAIKQADKGLAKLPTNDRAQLFRWADLKTGDEGAAVDVWQWDRASVQVFGTFSAGAALSIEGSHDGETFALLSDPQGLPLSFSTADLKAIAEPCRYVRPVTGGGDKETQLTVIVLARRA